MRQIAFSYKETSLLPAIDFERVLKLLEPEIKRASTYGFYQTVYASLENVKQLIDQILSQDPALVILIGIGGSSLGALALIQAIFGVYYNTINKIQFYCLDTVDSDTNKQVLVLIEKYLAEHKKVIVLIVTKSGTTTETIANAQAVLALVQKYNPTHWAQSVIAITDKDSALWSVAQQYKWRVLEIPTDVGGRFSVFTAVGLVPFGLLGGNITELVEGAAALFTHCAQKNSDNYAAISAAFLYLYYLQGKNIHDTFLFAPQLENLGKWYRQLMGESIGKKYNHAGSLVEVGITPTVSIGTTDLHSVAQLYLGGPRDKVTSFVHIQCSQSTITVYLDAFKNTPVDLGLTGMTLNTLMNAIFKGTCAAYSADQRPFVTIELEEISAYTLGAFMGLKMLEIVFLGYLLNINPFDQPNVEDYKRKTRDFLNHG